MDNESELRKKLANVEARLDRLTQAVPRHWRAGRTAAAID